MDSITATHPRIALQDVMDEDSSKTDSGVLKSSAVKGFEIPVQAIFDDTEKQQTLQQIMTSP